VFALGKGTSITLKDVLRTPDDVTFDGTCSGVTIQAPARIALMYIFGKRNVVVARLGFRQTDYVSGKPDDRGQTCIRLNGLVDAIAIMHNDVSRCGDGLIDITTSPSKPVPERARITIGYNRLADHDKVMLFGTFTCGPTGRDDEPCDTRELEHNRTSAPGLYLTLNDNLFYGTGQRHPRVFGRVMAHVLGNVIAYSSYGTFVSNGARALIEGNIYLMTGAPTVPKRAVWTTKTPGAMRMPWDVEGFIRARDNRTVGQAIIGENEPGLVDSPPYRQPRIFPGFNRLPLPEAIACVAARAGPDGLSRWPAPCQSGG
jgi:pectate lyase